MLNTRRRAALGCVALQPVLLALLAAPAAAATVAGGASHTLVVRTTDATVWAFGLNSDGELGDNTVTQRKTPIQVSGLSGVVAVAAGAKHSLALTSAGVLSRPPTRAATHPRRPTRSTRQGMAPRTRTIQMETSAPRPRAQTPGTTSGMPTTSSPGSPRTASSRRDSPTTRSAGESRRSREE